MPGKSGNDKDFDVIVVGSGPGGATTSKELAARGKRVLILEWGRKSSLNRKLLPIPRKFVGEELFLVSK